MKFLLGFLALGLLSTANISAQKAHLPSDGSTSPDIINPPDRLPRGIFPHIRTLNEDPDDVDNDGNFGNEMQNLGEQLGSTVRAFATRHNFMCFEVPCLMQAFPILYTKRKSGFFGGFRANLRDSLRPELPYYSVTTQIIRSDTDQWLTFLAFDFPKIKQLPLNPRIKFKGTYNKTTETRYFGIGRESRAALHDNDDRLRFGVQERVFQMAVLVPVYHFGPARDRELSIFSTVARTNLDTYPFDTTEGSKLFEDKPPGYLGAQSSRVSLGLLLDTRDREVNTRRGYATEASFETAGYYEPYNFRRYSLIDRRYISWTQNTFALRSTIDYITGDAPFWDREGVGGVDPIRNVAGSGILRAFAGGRFHERDKYIASGEYRRHLNIKRVFGIPTDITWPVVGADFGKLGPLLAWDTFAGADFLFNKSFLVRTLLGYAETGIAFSMRFDQEF